MSDDTDKRTVLMILGILCFVGTGYAGAKVETIGSGWEAAGQLLAFGIVELAGFAFLLTAIFGGRS